MSTVAHRHSLVPSAGPAVTETRKTVTFDPAATLSKPRTDEPDAEADRFPELVRVQGQGEGLESLNLALSFHFLQICCLAQNRLTEILALSNCPFLVKLDLSDNLLSTLPSMSFWRGLRRLRCLYLHNNPISSAAETMKLAGCMQIQIVTLHSTPISKERFYRHRLVNGLLSVLVVDNYVVCDEEVIEGARFQGRFTAKSNDLKIDSYLPSNKDESVEEELLHVFGVIVKARMLSNKHSPIRTIQRCLRRVLEIRRKQQQQQNQQNQFQQLEQKNSKTLSNSLINGEFFEINLSKLLASLGSKIIESNLKHAQQQQQQQNNDNDNKFNQSISIATLGMSPPASAQVMRISQTTAAKLSQSSLLAMIPSSPSSSPSAVVPPSSDFVDVLSLTQAANELEDDLVAKQIYKHNQEQHEEAMAALGVFNDFSNTSRKQSSNPFHRESTAPTTLSALVPVTAASENPKSFLPSVNHNAVTVGGSAPSLKSSLKYLSSKYQNKRSQQHRQTVHDIVEHVRQHHIEVKSVIQQHQQSYRDQTMKLRHQDVLIQASIEFSREKAEVEAKQQVEMAREQMREKKKARKQRKANNIVFLQSINSYSNKLQTDLIDASRSRIALAKCAQTLDVQDDLEQSAKAVFAERQLKQARAKLLEATDAIRLNQLRKRNEEKDSEARQAKVHLIQASLKRGDDKPQPELAPVYHTLYSAPGENVAYRAGPLPLTAYPRSMWSKLSLKDQQKLKLMELKAKWVKIGQFCDHEACRLEPRAHCENCYQLFHRFAKEELELETI